jgi:hypothetical protein
MTIFNDYELWSAGRRSGIKEGVKRGHKERKKMKLKEFKDYELIEEVLKRGISEAMVSKNKREEVKE